MSTSCYALLSSSVIRVTALDRGGAISSPVRYVTTSQVKSVRVDEVTEPGRSEFLRGSENDAPLLNIRQPEQTIKYTVEMDFLRVDPALLSLVAGVPSVTNAQGDLVGFDAASRLATTAFALEVWTRLADRCADGSTKYGYTLFPLLKGGTLSGFSFANGLVSFNMRRAQTRRSVKWGVGPYDLNGLHQRLLQPVSRNAGWRTQVLEGAAPVQTDGVVEFEDIIYGGTPSTTTADRLIGGSPSSTSEWIIQGGAP